MRHAMSAAGGLAVVLGCSGLATEPKVVERGPVRLELIDGDVTTDLDHGAEGDYDVDLGLTTQALSWAHLDDDFELEAYSHTLHDAMLVIFERQGLEAGDVTFSESEVAGRRSYGFTAEVEGTSLLSTSWICANSGVHVTLNTSGLFGVEDRHRSSLASATCLDRELDVQVVEAWRFIGTGWTEQESEGFGSWTRDDGEADLFVADGGALDDDLEICSAMLDVFLQNQALVELDTGALTPVPRPNGCVGTLEGSRDGKPVAAFVEHRTCGEHGYVGFCTVPRGEDAAATCETLLTCG